MEMQMIVPIVTDLPAKLRTMGLSEIAQLINRDWAKVNYAAKPYLDAMSCLDSIDDNYYADSGRSIVLYFLSNAAAYRGETARVVKAELNKRAA